MFDDQEHSTFAKTLIEKYRIGYVSSNGAMDHNSELFKLHETLSKKIDIEKPLLP